MKILVINQPINNRGDESAHKALLRRIQAALPEAIITVLFENEKEDSVQQFAVQSEKISYVNKRYGKIKCRGMGFAMNAGLKYGLRFLWSLQPYIRDLINLYKQSDCVLCAPGGMCLGGFQNWHHLFLLMLAKYTGKPLFYYGRSIGPFPEKTPDNVKFKELSSEILHYASFLSLRDKKSEEYAKEIGISKYVSVVDSAFLDAPLKKVPLTLSNKIGESRYIVFVPNLLIWHPAYKGKIEKSTLVDFYAEIIDVVMRKYPSHKILMLPQTFNYSTRDENDVNLFRGIVKIMDNDRVVAIDDTYSSDVQQTIISEADFVIGMRYHSIVFAINNAIPFIALSYEHKIVGLLKALNKTESLVDIEKLIMSKEGRAEILRQIKDRIIIGEKDYLTQRKSKEIAMNGFNIFMSVLKK